MSEGKEVGCFVLLIAGAIIGLIALAVIIESISCNARWGDYQHKFSIVGGCQVKIDGKWTPEDRIREFAA